MNKTKSGKGGQRAATAYHEAGHAVAAWLLHIRIRKVTIVPEGDALGYVLRRSVVFRKGVLETLECGAATDREQAWAQFCAERHAIYCFAGMEAQKRFNPRSVRIHHWKSDHDAAMKGLYFLTPRDSIRLYDRIMRIRTKYLLDRPDARVAVKALAEALVERRTLSGQEALDIMVGATGPPFPASRRKPPSQT